ncbi:Hypothetical predicted protein [Octopus vulgaris]|uniref:Uncharacterized protein n=1 Tax=Octopus vulgaris TaxID=6645 RepID=A0AA36B5X4_OCTVU|nr:Hypothetical predicted protein [Octopus vulgaris]
MRGMVKKKKKKKKKFFTAMEKLLIVKRNGQCDNESIIPSVYEEIVARLEMLSKTFDGYFAARKLETSEEWIMNPYPFKLDNMLHGGEQKEDLIELCENRVLKM